MMPDDLEVSFFWRVTQQLCPGLCALRGPGSCLGRVQRTLQRMPPMQPLNCTIGKNRQQVDPEEKSSGGGTEKHLRLGRNFLIFCGAEKAVKKFAEAVRFWPNPCFA